MTEQNKIEELLKLAEERGRRASEIESFDGPGARGLRALSESYLEEAIELEELEMAQ